MTAAILAAIGVGIIVLLGGIFIGLVVAQICERRARAITEHDHELGETPL